MDKLVITSSEELKMLIGEVIQLYLKDVQKQNEPLPDTLSLESALQFLNENGYSTSKGRLYQLTSQGIIPYGKYGNKLIFSRKKLLTWAETQTIQVTENTDGVVALNKSANKKM